MPDAPSDRRRTSGAWAVMATTAAVLAVLLGGSLLTRTGDNTPARAAGQPTDPAIPTPMSTSDLLVLTRQVECRAPGPGAVSREELGGDAADLHHRRARSGQVSDLPGAADRGHGVEGHHRPAGAS